MPSPISSKKKTEFPLGSFLGGGEEQGDDGGDDDEALIDDDSRTFGECWVSFAVIKPNPPDKKEEGGEEEI